jgi:hypothetical protein
VKTTWKCGRAARVACAPAPSMPAAASGFSGSGGCGGNCRRGARGCSFGTRRRVRRRRRCDRRRCPGRRASLGTEACARLRRSVRAGETARRFHEQIGAPAPPRRRGPHARRASAVSPRGVWLASDPSLRGLVAALVAAALLGRANGTPSRTRRGRASPRSIERTLDPRKVQRRDFGSTGDRAAPKSCGDPRERLRHPHHWARSTPDNVGEGVAHGREPLIALSDSPSVILVARRSVSSRKERGDRTDHAIGARLDIGSPSGRIVVSQAKRDADLQASVEIQARAAFT